MNIVLRAIIDDTAILFVKTGVMKRGPNFSLFLMFLIIARLIKAYSTVLFCNVLRIYLLSDDLLTFRIDF